VPDENEIRRIVVDEVHNQVGPLKSTVDRLDRTVRSLYSNGSGGPPGFLEVAREEDKKRQGELDGKLDDLLEYKNKMEVFIAVSKERDEVREKRRKMLWGLLWKIGGPIGVAIISILGWIYHASLPVIQILWQDYLHAHPAVMHELKNLSQDNHELIYATEHKLKDFADW